MAKWCVKLGEHWVGAERRRWALWRQKYWSWQKSQPQSLSLTWLTLIGFINSQIKMEECQHQGEINKFLFSWQKFQTPTDRKTGWMQHRILWSVSHCSFFILEIFILVWHYMKKITMRVRRRSMAKWRTVFLQQESRVCQSQSYWTDLSHTHAPVNIGFGVETKFSQDLLNLFYLRSYFSSW